MVSINLQHPFTQVENKGAATCGGSQVWSSLRRVRQWGCGVVSGLDILLYLSRWHGGRSGGPFDPQPEPPLPLDYYLDCLERLEKKYLPLIPRSGMSGLMLAWGLNRCLGRYGLPYRARWGLSGSRLWPRLEAMLAADIPVILAIGPNFPWVWRQNKLALYTRAGDGSYKPACRTKAHYVTVTGREGEWLRLSSWGREYYLNVPEYQDYIQGHSSPWVSNILWLRKKPLA